LRLPSRVGTKARPRGASQVTFSPNVIAPPPERSVIRLDPFAKRLITPKKRMCEIAPHEKHGVAPGVLRQPVAIDPGLWVVVE
jgi:hypothetical protein